MESLSIRRVALADLTEDPRNARRHPEENLRAIEESLRRFGQAEPLVVRRETGVVVGGNGRLEAMRRLGWERCDIVELSLTDSEATALSVALNRSGELASWDERALVELLGELQADEELSAASGYSEVELNELISSLEDEEGPREIDDPGAEEPPENPVSKPGDLWHLGEHRLLCGDATNPGDLKRLLGGEAPALLATDPPYCVDYTGDRRPLGSGKDWSGSYREVDIPDLEEFLGAFFEATLPLIRADAAVYIWHAHLRFDAVSRVFERFDLLAHQAIIWAKPSSPLGFSFYRWAHEPCLFGWRRGNKPPHYLENTVSTVWEVDWEGKGRLVGNEHPTQKPLRLFEIPMEQHTRAGELVLEPFCGSGSQILAAERLRRRCFALEVAPAFVDVALRRFEAATGIEPELESGESFSEIQSQRSGSDGRGKA